MVSHYRNWHSLFAFTEQHFEQPEYAHKWTNPMNFYERDQQWNAENPFNYINIMKFLDALEKKTPIKKTSIQGLMMMIMLRRDSRMSLYVLFRQKKKQHCCCCLK